MPPHKCTVGDLATLEGIVSFVEGHAMAQARALFEARGSVPMLAHLICTKGGEGFVLREGEIGVQTMLISQLPDRSAKDEVAEMIRERAIAYGAIGVILVMEAWILVTAGPPDREKIRREGLAAQPGRVEGVFVSCDHIRLVTRWTAMISRDAAGNGTLGSFERDKRRGDDAKGRFVDLLRRDRFS